MISMMCLIQKDVWQHRCLSLSGGLRKRERNTCVINKRPSVWKYGVGVLAVLGLLLLSTPASFASKDDFRPGDLLISQYDGTVEVRGADGTLKSTLSGPFAGQAQGMAFDSNRNLLVTYWWSTDRSNGNTVAVYRPDGSYAGTFGGQYNCQPTDVLVDSQGSVYVGDKDCAGQLLKFDSSGNLLQLFTVSSDNTGDWWMDLAPDGCTMYYTSNGRHVERYNVCTNTQLPYLNQTPLPGDGAGALGLRILPDGGVIVADYYDIRRLDSAGNVVALYHVVADAGFVDILLDPDGKTFWAASFDTSTVYRIDIATGQILMSFHTHSLAKAILIVPKHKGHAGDSQNDKRHDPDGGHDHD
jgi:DNA-binding beta-propeller fold protein YncE